jgi:probable rRNA maturation factor
MLPECHVERLRAVLEEISLIVAQVEGMEPGDVQCLIVDQMRIMELHSRFFGDPSPTDVITFPAGDGASSLWIEGDIAICLEVAREQASAAGHSALREIAFLGTHGILHLAGWGDGNPADRAAMLDRQESLLREVEERGLQL